VPGTVRLYTDRNQFDLTSGDAVTLHCVTAVSGQGSLRVYNVRGMVVRHLWKGPLTQDSMLLAWDGIDDQGQRVRSGLYLLLLEAGGHSEIKKLVVIHR